MFKFNEFSIKKDFIIGIFSFSSLIMLLKKIILSEAKKTIIKIKKFIPLKIIILFEKLNISFEAKEVT